MKSRSVNLRRVLLFVGLVVALSWGAMRQAEAYTRQTCIGNVLYIVFYDSASDAYQGYIRQPNSPSCP